MRYRVTPVLSAFAAVTAFAVFVSACGGKSPTTATAVPSTPTTPPSPTTPTPVLQPVYVVLFTHIEDNTPAGALDSPATRTGYLNIRGRLLEMATLARSYGMAWSLQPDWKILLAAQQFEDASMMASTGGVNIFRYLRDSLGVTIDPHSHEGSGYNYSDVAYLLSTLGVGGSTVIGGHIWDPALPQFQEWDRFRVPVRGSRYPEALWRGDILMGSGTPNHVNDPVVSGMWRPKNRNAYFEDDPAGNIACVGAYKSTVAGISELIDLYRTGQARAGCMLTGSIGIPPATITAAGGLSSIESTILGPLASLRGASQVELTTFSSLVDTWKSRFAGQSCTYNVTTGQFLQPSSLR